MKAQDWEPTSSFADKEDVKACCKSSRQFFGEDEDIEKTMKGMNEREKEIFLFNCGFSRSLNWSEFKFRYRGLYQTVVIKQFVDLTKEKVDCMEQRMLHACNDCPEYSKCERYKEFFQSWVELHHLVNKGGD